MGSGDFAKRDRHPAHMTLPSGRRVCWTNSAEDVKSLWELMDRILCPKGMLHLLEEKCRHLYRSKLRDHVSQSSTSRKCSTRCSSPRPVLFPTVRLTSMGRCSRSIAGAALPSSCSETRTTTVTSSTSPFPQPEPCPSEAIQFACWGPSSLEPRPTKALCGYDFVAVATPYEAYSAASAPE